jgi:predicted nuclease of predicted toxin-antitoxin system
MKIKLDENISRHLKIVVNQKGHEAITVEDEGLLGKTDVEVGAVAKSEGRMLFTLDVEFSKPPQVPTRKPSRHSPFSTPEHGASICKPLRHSIL